MSQEHSPSPAATATPTKPRVIGLVCERSVHFTDQVDAQHHLLDHPEVKIIPVPCSGHIQPIMIETALKNGAEGVFALGCRIGDCHYRDGNRFCRERLLGERMPKLKPNVDKRRVQAFWLSAIEYDLFNQLLVNFLEELAALDQSAAAPTAAGGIRP